MNNLNKESEITELLIKSIDLLKEEIKSQKEEITLIRDSLETQYKLNKMFIAFME